MSKEGVPYTNIRQRSKRLVMLRHVTVELTQEQRIKKYRRRFMYQLARRSEFGSNPQSDALLAYFLNGLNGLGSEW